jgi:hypothetical protein
LHSNDFKPWNLSKKCGYGYSNIPHTDNYDFSYHASKPNDDNYILLSLSIKPQKAKSLHNSTQGQVCSFQGVDARAGVDSF